MSTTVAALPLGPLDPERGELLRRVVDGLDTAALQWLSGFAAGVAYARTAGAGTTEPVVPAAVAVAPRAEAAGRLAVVYGSQTGNGRRAASRSSTARRPATAGASPSGSARRPRPPASRCGCTPHATTRCATWPTSAC